MNLELVARLMVETWLYVDPGDIRVDVHDEHGAVGAREDVHVVDIELAVLSCERRIEMMRHRDTSFFQVMA